MIDIFRVLSPVAFNLFLEAQRGEPLLHLVQGHVNVAATQSTTSGPVNGGETKGSRKTSNIGVKGHPWSLYSNRGRTKADPRSALSFRQRSRMDGSLRFESTVRTSRGSLIQTVPGPGPLTVRDFCRSAHQPKTAQRRSSVVTKTRLRHRRIPGG